MVQPLLHVLYNELPGLPVEGEIGDWIRRSRGKLTRFKHKVVARYSEGTLEKLLGWHDAQVRQAAVLSLGLLGSFKATPILAARLRDDDPVVRHLAADALWSIWFRAESPEHNQQLQRLLRLDPSRDGLEDVLTGYARLLAAAPTFAEAYNQRAVVHFRAGNFAKAIVDCEKTLRLNPHHFGAACGLGQCFMKLKKFRAALRSYRRAHRINPNLDNVRQAIASLEEILGEEGKR